MGLSPRTVNPVAGAPTLTEAKAGAKRIVDSRAEAARLQFITAGAGQALVYERKRAEAEAWDAAGSPDPADYPLLKARAERLNAGTPDYQAVADEWNAQSAAWQVAAAAIEGLREGAKDAIDVAGDIAGVHTAMDITWPTPA